MTDKAYIVANKQQEREVLEKLEREGLKWKGFSEEPTQWLPTRDIGYIDITFPYVLFGDDVVSWCSISELKDIYEIVFDGRKESKMSDKYVVSQEFMDELEEWKLHTVVTTFINGNDIKNLPYIINNWWFNSDISDKEYNNRIIAIIRWVNGEDVFKVEKPKKWVVRSKDIDEEGYHLYVNLSKDLDILHLTTFYGLDMATRFDTKEEAESWANSHQEVRELIEVKE